MEKILIILLAIAAVAIILMYAYIVKLERQSTIMERQSTIMSAFADAVLDDWGRSMKIWEKRVTDQTVEAIDKIIEYLVSEEQLRPDQFRIVYDEIEKIRETYTKDVG